MNVARHHLLLLPLVLLGLVQLVFPEWVARLSGAVRRLVGSAPPEDDLREAAHAFRIIGVLTLVFALLSFLRVL